MISSYHLDGVSPTLTENGGTHLPLGSLSSMRSRTFLENAINWGPVVKKYLSLKESPDLLKDGETPAELKAAARKASALGRKASTANGERHEDDDDDGQDLLGGKH